MLLIESAAITTFGSPPRVSPKRIHAHVAVFTATGTGHRTLGSWKFSCPCPSQPLLSSGPEPHSPVIWKPLSPLCHFLTLPKAWWSEAAPSCPAKHGAVMPHLSSGQTGPIGQGRGRLEAAWHPAWSGHETHVTLTGADTLDEKLIYSRGQ